MFVVVINDPVLGGLALPPEDVISDPALAVVAGFVVVAGVFFAPNDV